MKRGWRNDPAWIAHYQRRDEERAKRELERVRIEHQSTMLDMQIALQKRQPAFDSSYRWQWIDV